MAQWAQWSVGDGIRVTDNRGIVIEGTIDARSQDGRTIWVTDSDLYTRRLFHITDHVLIQRTTRALNRT
jgi:hypothetical protein